MLKLSTDWMLSRIADMLFMALATVVSMLGGYIALAALFAAKGVLSLINLVVIYRRNQRLRFQLVEHLYRDDQE
ncbi:MAG: hypothetical protein OEZ43_15000 [Gammaproteobacteria bacterium]|nr:hypothetical protein [Gammaproteobacteria bacterium]